MTAPTREHESWVWEGGVLSCGCGYSGPDRWHPKGTESVHHDTVRGHIRIGELTFADLGNATLSVWAHEGCTLTPTAAHDLAAALTAWAARWDAS